MALFLLFRNRSKHGQRDIGTLNTALPLGINTSGNTCANQAQVSVSALSTPTSSRERHLPFGILTTPTSLPQKDSSHSSELPVPVRCAVDTLAEKVANWNYEEAAASSGITIESYDSKKQRSHLSSRCSQQLASISPIVRVQYSNENLSSLKDFPEGKGY